MSDAIEARFLGGVADGHRIVWPRPDPTITIVQYTEAGGIWGGSDSTDYHPRHTGEIQYLRKREPKADHVWEYVYVPPPPENWDDGT